MTDAEYAAVDALSVDELAEWLEAEFGYGPDRARHYAAVAHGGGGCLSSRLSREAT